MGLSPFGVDLGINLPNFTSGGLLFWILIILVIVFFLFASALAIYIYYQRKLFFINIKIFENIGGEGWRLTKSDRARIVKVGDEVIVMHGADVRAVGIAMMNSDEMTQSSRGEAIKVRHYKKEPVPP